MDTGLRGQSWNCYRHQVIAALQMHGTHIHGDSVAQMLNGESDQLPIGPQDLSIGIQANTLNLSRTGTKKNTNTQYHSHSVLKTQPPTAKRLHAAGVPEPLPRFELAKSPWHQRSAMLAGPGHSPQSLVR